MLLSSLLAFFFNAITWKGYCKKKFPAKIFHLGTENSLLFSNQATGSDPVWDLQLGEPVAPGMLNPQAEMAVTPAPRKIQTVELG